MPHALPVPGEPPLSLPLPLPLPTCSPEGSGAHFTGSQGCLSCYFGEPKVAAGTVDGVPGFASMPSEQPRPGEVSGVWRVQRWALLT